MWGRRVGDCEPLICKEASFRLGRTGDALADLQFLRSHAVAGEVSPLILGRL